MQRPKQYEYPEYYVPYVSLVPEGDLLTILKENLKKAVALFEDISEADEHFRYEPGKWSIKGVLAHITDTERVMSYRLLRMGRGDQTPLAGFNQEQFVQGSQAENLQLKNILADFVATRKATITLMENMPESAWENKGYANNTEVTTRAVAYILAGHEMHHRNILTERYLAKLK